MAVEAIAQGLKLDWLPPEMRTLIPQLSDSQIVASTLYGECRSEPIEGIVAVCCVIRNRVKADLHGDNKPDWWGEGYPGVCLAPWQFSCWHPKGGEANYVKLLTLVQQFAAKTPEVTDKLARQCIGVAEIVMREYAIDNTKGSTHYHAANITPTWAKGVPRAARIGRHVFYSQVK